MAIIRDASRAYEHDRKMRAGIRGGSWIARNREKEGREERGKIREEREDTPLEIGKGRAGTE